MKRLLTASTILIGAAALASAAYADSEVTNIGGSGNTVTVNQNSGAGTNESDIDIGGSFGPSDNNTVFVQQVNPGAGITQSSEIDINIANTNDVSVIQSGNGTNDATSQVTIRSGADGNEVDVSQTANSGGSTTSASSVVDINDTADDGNGDNNDVTVTQNNSLNVHSTVTIVGQNNAALVNQQNASGGGTTTATITLNGMNNGRGVSADSVGIDSVDPLGVTGINIFQSGTGAGTEATIDITGNGNDAQIEQNGDTQVATITVTGGVNSRANQLLLRQTANADGADASVDLTGLQNSVFTFQDALNASSTVSINGNQNETDVNQTGDNAISDIAITGNLNTVSHNQSADGASATDTIVGDGNTITVVQN